MGENHKMFSYIYQEYIHRKNQLPNSPAPTGRRYQPQGSYNPLNSLATIGRRLQPPSLKAPTPCVLWLQLEGGYDPLIYRIKPEGSSNSLSSLAPTRRRLQPPFLSSSFHPKYNCRLKLSLPMINL
jgi:hypothetical protein